MPLEVRNLGAREKDILTGPGGGLLLLDLEFHNVGRVLDNFRDICDVARANFTKNALADPDNTTNKPVPLYDTQ